METIAQPIEISFPLPKAPHAILHCQLTFLEACSLIHLTTTELGQSGSSITPMGSLVYAIPDRLNEKQVISTALCESGSSIEYATRVSKILARKTKLPAYVSCSMNFAGITPDEEMEGLTRVVEEIMTRFNAKGVAEFWHQLFPKHGHPNGGGIRLDVQEGFLMRLDILAG